MSIDETTTLNATIEPTNATNQEMEWISSDEKVINVNENGVVTAVVEGEAVITIKAKNEDAIQAICNIVVINQENVDYLYYKGAMNENFGEIALIANTENNSIATFETDHIFCSTSNRCGTYNAKIGTVNEIDLSNYSTLVIELLCTNYKGEGHFGPGIVSTSNKDTFIAYTAYSFDGSDSGFIENEICEMKLDISSISSGHPCISFTYDEIEVYKMYLVKK